MRAVDIQLNQTPLTKPNSRKGKKRQRSVTTGLCSVKKNTPHTKNMKEKSLPKNM